MCVGLGYRQASLELAVLIQSQSENWIQVWGHCLQVMKKASEKEEMMTHGCIKKKIKMENRVSRFELEK